LRQAHDADLVELSKNERGFEVGLKGETAPVVVPAEPEARSGRGSRGGRRGRGRAGPPAASAAEPAAEPVAQPVAAAVPPPAPPAPAAHATPSRGIRYRHGSGRPTAPAAGVPMVGMVEVEATEPEKPKGPARRRVRGGAGRRPAGRARTKKKPEEPSSDS
jgi:hypothetical protein